MKNQNPLSGVDLQKENVQGELAPLEFDPRDRDKFGLPPEGGPGPAPGADLDGQDQQEQVFVVSETAVKTMIKSLFFAGYMWHGDGHEHWLENEVYVDEIVPGMTKFINQFPLLARAVEFGDTNAAPVKLLVVLVKNQIQSVRLKRQDMQDTGADPAAVQFSAESGGKIQSGGLYDGLLNNEQ